MATQTQIMVAAGFSGPFQFHPSRDDGRHNEPIITPSNPFNGLAPALIVNLSSGASLTYNIEVTGEPTQGTSAGGYPSTEAWNQADSASGLTVSVNYAFSGCVQAVRINITSYTSGTLTASFVRP